MLLIILLTKWCSLNNAKVPKLASITGSIHSFLPSIPCKEGSFCVPKLVNDKKITLTVVMAYPAVIANMLIFV